MGAHSIAQYVETEKSLRDAWEQVYLESRVTHGVDPYSGTFATCSGALQVADLMSLGEAEIIADEMFKDGIVPQKLRQLIRPNIAGADGRILRGPQKWGSAYVIPVYTQRKLRTKTGTITVEHDTSGYLGVGELRGLAEARLEVPYGSWISHLSVVEDKVRSRKVVERSVGKRTCTWMLFNERGELENRGVEYATEREAIKAAEQILHKSIESGWAPGSRKIEVRGILRRENRATRVAAELVGRKTKLSYQLNTTTDRSQGGWYFFGLAAS